MNKSLFGIIRKQDQLPGLIVLDGSRRPVTILPGTDVLKMAVPRYYQSDPTLARVVDEAAADVFTDHLHDKTVAEVLPDELRELPVVDADATALEIASLMARSRSPLVAVVDRICTRRACAPKPFCMKPAQKRVPRVGTCAAV